MGAAREHARAVRLTGRVAPTARARSGRPDCRGRRSPGPGRADGRGDQRPLVRGAIEGPELPRCSGTRLIGVNAMVASGPGTAEPQNGQSPHGQSRSLPWPMMSPVSPGVWPRQGHHLEAGHHLGRALAFQPDDAITISGQRRPGRSRRRLGIVGAFASIASSSQNAASVSAVAVVRRVDGLAIVHGGRRHGRREDGCVCTPSTPRADRPACQHRLGRCGDAGATVRGCRSIR